MTQTTSNWTITVGTPSIVLDGRRRAAATFTVTNTGPQPDRVVVDILTDDPASRGWVSLADPQRPVAAGATVTYEAVVTVPPGAPVGSHWLVARAYSADTAPEESSTRSDRVTFDVPPATAPAPRRNWWPIVSVAALVLSVLAVLTAVLLGGRPGPAGPGGPRGPAGATGGQGRELVAVSQQSPPFRVTRGISAVCLAGKVPLGGGYDLDTVSPLVVVGYSRPTADGMGWELSVYNGSGSTVSVTVYAICADK